MRIYPIKLYLRSLPNAIALSLSFIMQIWLWVWLLVQIRPQEEFIFLHYNVLFGVDRIGPWWQIFALPAIGLLFFILNALIGWVTYEKDELVGYFFNSMTVLLHIFLGIAAYLLVFLNV